MPHSEPAEWVKSSISMFSFGYYRYLNSSQVFKGRGEFLLENSLSFIAGRIATL